MIPVPYTIPISNVLYRERSILISGIPRSNASRFSINFMCGPNFNTDDVAFHFDVRFKFGSYREKVIMSSRTSGQWEKKENIAKGFPFATDAPFEIKILTKSNKFKIFIDGIHFTDFMYCMEFAKVNHLSIQEDVILKDVSLA